MNVVMEDGRVFTGSAVQVVRAMRELAFGVEHFTLGEYVDWVVANARMVHGAELEVRGDTDEERARSLVQEMLRTGLARGG